MNFKTLNLSNTIYLNLLEDRALFEYIKKSLYIKKLFTLDKNKKHFYQSSNIVNIGVTREICNLNHRLNIIYLFHQFINTSYNTTFLSECFFCLVNAFATITIIKNLDLQECYNNFFIMQLYQSKVNINKIIIGDFDGDGIYDIFIKYKAKLFFLMQDENIYIKNHNNFNLLSTNNFIKNKIDNLLLQYNVANLIITSTNFCSFAHFCDTYVSQKIGISTKNRNKLQETWKKCIEQKFYFKKNFIPQKTHSIWITKPINTRDVPYLDKILLKDLVNHLYTNNTEWVYNMWTNNESYTLIKNSFYDLSISGFSINFIEKILLYQKILNHILSLKKNNYFASISDLLRAAIVYEYGGIYVDTGMVLHSSPLQLHSYFDYYFGNGLGDTISNTMFASIEKNHIILSIINNILDSQYINCKNLSPMNDVILKSGVCPYTVAVYKYLNNLFQLNNENLQGIVLTNEVLFFELSNKIFEKSGMSLDINNHNYQSYNIGSVSEHKPSGSWVEDLNNINYNSLFNDISIIYTYEN